MKNNRVCKKLLIALIELLLIVGIVSGVILLIESVGIADGDPVRAYIICQPGDYVNARLNPSRKSTAIGRLESGDDIWLDGDTNNGFAHCVDTTFEACECWVYSGYIVFDEPEWRNGQTAIVTSNARLAARRNCSGEVRKWLNTGDEVQVFWLTDEWCVTNYGFIKTFYLELVGE